MKLPTYSGIYQITNKENGKAYIGSAVNLRARWVKHRSELVRGVHHSRYLQNAWDKYGADAFECKLLLVCDKTNLLMYEQRCLDGFKPEYNCAPTAGSCLGVKQTDEFKARVSRQWKGVSPSEETRRKISETLKGRKLGKVSATRLEQMTAASRAWAASEEGKAHFEKIALQKKGVERPAEVREKLSKAIARLTDDQIRELRAQARSGIPQKLLAVQYGMSQPSVSDIMRGATYKWVV